MKSSVRLKFENKKEKLLRCHEKQCSLGLALHGGRTQVMLFDSKSVTHACKTFFAKNLLCAKASVCKSFSV